MSTDRSDRKDSRFTDFVKGARADEFIFGDRGYTEDDITYMEEGVNSLLTGTPTPPIDPTADPTWSAVINDNKLLANLSVFNYTTEDGAAYRIVEDSATEPTNDAVVGTSPPTGFTQGTWPNTYDLVTYGVSKDLYFYQYDDTNGITLVKQEGTGLSFITLQATATAPPVPITDFTSDSSTDTTATVSFSSTTIIDEVTLVYDIVDTNVLGNDGQPTLINSSGSDVTPGTVVITGLTPGTTYSLAVRVTPENDLSRAYISDPDPITTTITTTLTFTGFTLTDGGTNEDDAVITVFTTTGSPDLWYWSFSPVAPTINSTWLTSIPSPSDELTLGAAGVHSVYAWISLTTDPTNIVPFTGNPATVVLAPDSGDDIWSIDAENSDLVISEMGAPTGTITIKRSPSSGVAQTVNIVSTDDTAVAGQNYKPINATVNFGASDTSLTVDYDVLLQNIGHTNGVPNEVTFDIALSGESNGSISASNGAATVTIQGSNGYVGPVPSAKLTNALNGIDVNNPPTDLPVLSGTLTPAASSTYDGYIIDGNGNTNTVAIGQAANNVTFKRCIIKNAGKSLLDFKGWASGLTITNCVMRDWHLDWKSYLGPRWDNLAIKCYPLSYGVAEGGEDLSDITVRGNRAVGHGSFAQFQYTRNADNHIFENNHFHNTTNLDLGMTRAEYRVVYQTNSYNCRDGTFYQHQAGRGGGHSIRDNVVMAPREGGQAGCVLDVINFATYLPTSEAGRSYCEGNAIVGSVEDHFGSSFGLICDGMTETTGGYLTWQYNVVIEMPNGGSNIAPGTDATGAKGTIVGMVNRRNIGYANQNSIELGPNGVAVAGAGDGSIDNTTTDNDIWYYAWTADGTVRPNHQYWYPGDARPTGWLAQNLQNGTSGTQNLSLNGETILKQVRAILNNPAIGDGIKCKYASYNCVVGNGTLRWDYIDTSSGTLYFTAYGDAEGTGVSIDLTVVTDPVYGDWQQDYYVYSGNADNWIKVIVNPALLKTVTTDTAYNVKVTSFKYMDPNIMIQPYNQTTGDYSAGIWAGTEEVTIGGTTKPATPTGLAAVAGSSAGEVDLSWDDMSLPGYRVYRDGILIASPTGLAYTDTGRTNSVQYSYQVASISADDPPVLSDLSSPVNFTPTAALPNQLADLDNDTNWGSTSLSSVTDNGDSTYTLTNSTTTTGSRKYEFGTGSSPDNSGNPVVAGHTYRITWKHLSGTANGRIVLNNSNAAYVYAGDLGNRNVENVTLTEDSIDVVPTGTTMQLYLFVNSAVSGATTIFTTPTVEDLDA